MNLKFKVFLVKAVGQAAKIAHLLSFVGWVLIIIASFIASPFTRHVIRELIIGSRLDIGPELSFWGRIRVVVCTSILGVTKNEYQWLALRTAVQFVSSEDPIPLTRRKEEWAPTGTAIKGKAVFVNKRNPEYITTNKARTCVNSLTGVKRHPLLLKS